MAAAPQVEPAPGVSSGRQAAASKREWIRYAAASALVLAPCYWQSRIQAGDLSSHIYNTWLAELIAGGKLPGLTIAHQNTNVLFDLLLDAFWRLAGPDWAQRLAVSAAVLIFVWGVFAFASATAERRPWHVLPAIAMLAYGWVFHMGFFNFYLAMGMSCCALALLWHPSAWRCAAAAVILAIAYTAHALPVFWAVGLTAFVWLARQVSDRGRAILPVAGVGLLCVLHIAIGHIFASRWSPSQLSLSTGADQLWIFDGKYYFLQAGLLLVWGILFVQLVRERSGREVLGSLPFQLCLLSGAAVAILPSAIALPGYYASLVYIAERMSMSAGVCACALLASIRPRGIGRYALPSLAILFFALLFRDERALNQFEDRLTHAVAQLPPQSRVVTPFIDPAVRVNPLAHTIDRACLGRCYSYANYEPSTAAFRIRAVGANPFVVDQYGPSWDLQNGKHVVQAGELPLIRIGIASDGEFIPENMQVGQLCRESLWNVLWNQQPRS